MNPTRTDRTAESRAASAAGRKSYGENRRSSSRRGVLRAVSGAAAVGVIAGCLDDIGATGDGGDYSDSFDEDGNPDYGDWFDDVDNYDGTVEARDEDEVAIAVGANGGLAFDPPAILIEPGTTVRWEWTGNGGRHDVAHVDGAFESDRTGEAGHTFEQTFDEPGIYRYVCNPHQRAGMKGAIAVSAVENEDSETAASRVSSP